MSKSKDQHIRFGHAAGATEAVELDLAKFLRTRALIESNSGGGKSYLIRRLTEVLFHHVPIIIVDLEGEFLTLRDKYPFLVGGIGDGYDFVTDPQSAGTLARKILELRASVILDLSEVKKEKRSLFVKHFLESFVDSNKKLWTPYVIIIDEAHHFCLTEDTEILTEYGWESYKALGVGKSVACYDAQDSGITYQPISHLFYYPVENESLVDLSNSDSINALVTTDHRVVCQTRTTLKNRVYAWSLDKFVSAMDLPTGIRVPVVARAGFSGQTKVLNVDDDLLRIIGWILSDGYLDGKSYRIAQSKPRFVKKFRAILTRRFNGISFYSRQRVPNVILGKQVLKKRREYDFYLGVQSSKIVDVWLDGCADRIPRIFLNQLSRAQLRVLFEGLVDGDGNRSCSRNGFSAVTFYPGKNEGLADDFQELCVKLGYSCVKSKSRSNGQWYLRVSFKRKYAHVRRPKLIKYSGTIWDITVPTGAFIARRKGKVFVTGNCPQASKQESEALAAVVDLVTRGRKRGFCGILATQRISKLHKDATAELLNKFIGRTSQDIDMKRAADELGFRTDADEKSLRDLEEGEFFVFGPAISKAVQKVKIDKVVTHHPEIGEDVRSLKPIAPTPKIKAMLQKLSDVPGQAKQELHDVESLRSELRKRDHELRELRSQQGKPKEIQKVVVDKAAVHKAMTEGVALGKKQAAQRVIALLTKVSIIFQQVIKEQTAYATQLVEKVEPYVFDRPLPLRAVEPTTPKREVVSPSDEEVKLMAGPRKILTYLAQYFPNRMTRGQVGGYTGYASTGGTFQNYLSQLKKVGFIDETSNGLAATEEGRNFLGEIPEAPRTANDVFHMWRGKLPAGPRKMFEILYTMWQDGNELKLTREDLAEQSGFTASGGTFSNYLSLLRRNKLIVETGGYVALNPEILPS